MEVASTPELANLGHLVYQLNNKVAFLEQRLGQEEKKVADLEVTNRELAVGFEHLVRATTLNWSSRITETGRRVN